MEVFFRELFRYRIKIKDFKKEDIIKHLEEKEVLNIISSSSPSHTFFISNMELLTLECQNSHKLGPLTRKLEQIF